MNKIDRFLMRIFDYYWNRLFIAFINTPEENKVNKLSDMFFHTKLGKLAIHTTSTLTLVMNKFMHVLYLRFHGIKLYPYKDISTMPNMDFMKENPDQKMGGNPHQ